LAEDRKRLVEVRKRLVEDRKERLVEDRKERFYLCCSISALAALMDLLRVEHEA